jgi:hypothetical protein
MVSTVFAFFLFFKSPILVLNIFSKNYQYLVRYYLYCCHCTQNTKFAKKNCCLQLSVVKSTFYCHAVCVYSIHLVEFMNQGSEKLLERKIKIPA